VYPGSSGNPMPTLGKTTILSFPRAAGAVIGRINRRKLWHSSRRPVDLAV
jgi:hypothetical protein